MASFRMKYWRMIGSCLRSKSNEPRSPGHRVLRLPKIWFDCHWEIEAQAFSNLQTCSLPRTRFDCMKGPIVWAGTSWKPRMRNWPVFWFDLIWFDLLKPKMSNFNFSGWTGPNWPVAKLSIISILQLISRSKLFISWKITLSSGWIDRGELTMFTQPASQSVIGFPTSSLEAKKEREMEIHLLTS